jgi:hypothetical protein
MYESLKNAVKQLVSQDGKVSHKRFVTVVSTVLLCVSCYIVWKNGTATEVLYLVGTLVSFISALVGITGVVENRKERIKNESGKPEREVID